MIHLFSKRAFAIALPLTILLGACSSTSEPAGDGESVGEATQAFGEAACATATPDATFAGSITNYVSPTTYSNAHCYKSLVVAVTSVTTNLEDIVITDMNVTPPPGPLDPNGVMHPITSHTRVPSPAREPPMTKEECESLSIGAWLYVTNGPGPAPAHRTSTGQWIPFDVPASDGSEGYCVVPKVVFGGATWRQGDYDLLTPGSSYAIAATYRDANTSHAATRALRMYSPAVTCGLPGLPCCLVDQGSGSKWCSAFGEVACRQEQTDTPGVCEHCGDKDETCCDNSSCHSGLACLYPRGRCETPCGGETQACCGGSSCGAGLACNGGACAKIPCGDANLACCATGAACHGSLTCQSGNTGNKCKAPPVVVPPVVTPPVTTGCGLLNQPCCGGICARGTGFVCGPVTASPGVFRCFGASSMCGAPNQLCCDGNHCDDQNQNASFSGNACNLATGHCVQSP